MWGNDKKNTRHDYDTLVSSKTELVGDICFSGGLHIDGRVKGSVIAEEGSNAVVRISSHGLVEGEVKAPHVIINGQVVGDVYSSEHVELAQNASVTGTVHYNLLEMVMGAQVNGNLVHEAADDVNSPAAKATVERLSHHSSDNSQAEVQRQPFANT